MGKRNKRQKKEKVSLHDMGAQNAAKTLFANIGFLSVDSPLKTIVITSAVPGEGKTVTSIYLGNAIATSGKSVLLVECDMRRRSLARNLEMHSTAGLYAVLNGSVSLRSAISRVPLSANGTLALLDVEPGIPNPPDILSSKRFRAFVEEAKKHFDYVIFDTPPVGTFVDAAILSNIVDGVVLVARPGLVRRDVLVSAYDQLQKAGANVVGVCTTFNDGTGSDYYYYDYYYEDENGKRIKVDKSKAAIPQEQAPAAPLRGGLPAVSAASASAAPASAANAAATSAPTAGAQAASPLAAAHGRIPRGSAQGNAAASPAAPAGAKGPARGADSRKSTLGRRGKLK